LITPAARERSARARIRPLKTEEGNAMNWERIQGNWKQLTGKAKEQWGKLTNDDWDVVAGRRDQFAGKVQERYGLAKDEAEKRIGEWERKATDSWFVMDKAPKE